MNKTPSNGTRLIIDETDYIYYYGYWIRYYQPLTDTLSNRKLLIDSLTRRAFHHTEAGISTPGKSLDQARIAYESETNPARKRVNAAMLAGSLFHRATDLFTSIVDLGELGVQVSRDNELMRQCSGRFQEALTLGKQVKHYSGCEGIDEIWGEPFKAFTMPPTTEAYALRPEAARRLIEYSLSYGWCAVDYILAHTFATNGAAFRSRVFFADPPVSYQPLRERDSDIQNYVLIGQTELSGGELRQALAQAALLKAASKAAGDGTKDIGALLPLVAQAMGQQKAAAGAPR